MEFASPSSVTGKSLSLRDSSYHHRRNSNSDQYSTPYSSIEPLSLDDDNEICSPQIPISSSKTIAHPEKLNTNKVSYPSEMSYEVVWRDEKIRLLEQERNSAMVKIEEYAKQNLSLREELKKSQKNTNNPVNEINQLKHERNSIQEYAEQIRQQKNFLQEQLNMLKQGQGNVEKDLEKKDIVLKNQENQIRDLSQQLISFQKQCEQLISEREKMKCDLNDALTNLHIKSAELEELNGVQEELLKAMSEEKKRANELSKIQTSEQASREKIKKENERLELLVDKLQSDFKREQQECFNQRLKYNASLEEIQKRMQDEIDDLSNSLTLLKRESEEKEIILKNQIHSQQQKISSLTDQVRDQMEKYEKNLTVLKTEESEEKKKHSHQVSKFKKELSSSIEMIRLLKEANKNLEDNFVQHQKIISALEDRLKKEKEEKEELADHLDILKNKLPKMLSFSEY